MKQLIFILAILLGTFSTIMAQNQGTNNYEIQFIKVPPPGCGPDGIKIISGLVKCKTTDSLRIVLYAYCSGVWYVQPRVDSPFTEILPDGNWFNETHLGIKYVALLVKPSYKPVGKLKELPELGNLVLSKSVTLAKPVN